MKRIKEFSLKIIICTIVFGLTLNMVPIPVLALLFPTKIDEVVEKLEKIMSDEPEIIGEIEEKRDTYEKHYLMSDGTIMAAIYPTAVHYKENGKFVEYDNTLTTENGRYTPNRNDLDIQFSKNNSATDTVSMKNKNHTLKMGMRDTNETSSAKTSKKQSSNRQKMEVNSIKSDITYEKVLGNIDLKYDIISNAVKESIIINDKKSIQYEFIYDIETDLKVKQVEKNELSFVDDKGNEIFILNAPYMYDEVLEFSDGITLTPTKTKTGYMIKMELDKKWLDDEARVYPIVVDPSLLTNRDYSAIQDTYIYNGDAGNNTKGTAHILRAGSTNAASSSGRPFRSLIKFTLPTLTAGDQVVSATLNLFNYSGSENPSGTIQVDIHAVTQDWVETAAYWATMNTKYNAQIIDYFKYSYSSSSPNQQYTADITSIVKDWYNNGNNYGIMLKEHTEVNNLSRGDFSFVSSDTSTAYYNYRPVIGIIYRNQTGLEGYLTTHAQNIGRITTYTNDYNGNLTLIHPDASTPGSLMPASVYHVYNTNDWETNIGYGNGYRLNLNQTLESKTLSGTTYLMYIDEDGTRHYFTNSSNTWSDEDGLGLKITGNTTSNPTEYYMTDKAGNKSTFIKNGSKWYLKYIDDTSSNRITINYNTSNYNQITSVVDAVGDTITLIYTSNLLTSITDPANRTISYTYTANNLTSIAYPDNETTNIQYNAKNMITKITGIDGYYINYGYYTASPYRVKTITEYSSSGVVGNGYTIEYGHNTTKFMDTKGNTNVYTFNNLGQTLGIGDFGEDNTIKDAYGISYQYGTSGNTKNKLLLETPLIKSTNNYIINSRAENSLTNWTATGTVSVNTSEYIIGNKSFKLDSTATTGETSLIQTVPVQAEKIYTLSAYVKGSVTTSTTTSGLFFYYEYKDTNNQIVKEYKKIDVASAWGRYSTTFTLPTGSSVYKVGIVIKNTKGTIYTSNIQLEEGKVYNPYNLIENGNFVNGELSWGNKTGLSANDQVVSIDGVNAFRITGELKGKNISQDINIPIQAGDTFNIGYWAKNLGVPTDSTKLARIVVDFKEANGSYTQREEIHISADNKNWQYISGQMVANNTYVGMRVYITFNQNISNIYYTNIGIFKDEHSNSYTYDANGNLIGVSDLADQNSEFKYNKNDQLALSISPKGRRFQYEYDYAIKNRILQGFNQNGLTYSFEYDSYGNVTSNKIEEPKHVKAVSDINTNKTYYIKPVYSNLYVSVNGTNVELSSTPYEWKFQSISTDEFYIYNTNNQRMEVVGGATANSTNIAVAAQSNVAKQQFKLVSNNDGTYSIKTKVTSYGSAIDISGGLFEQGRNIHQYTSSANNLAQTFQIIATDAPQGKYIESSAEYTQDGNYQTKTINQREKETTFSYNQNTGTLSSSINPNNVTTNYSYDIMNRTTSMTSGLTTNTYTYNNDRLNTITHNGFNYAFLYDSFGNTTNIKVGTQNLITNTYEPNNGYLTQSTYGNGNQVSYTYDKFGRTSTKTNQTGTASYEYDNRGNLAKLNYNNVETTYLYDLSGRIGAIKQNGNYRINYTYDQYNNLSFTEHKFNSTYRKREYKYDLDNKVTEIIHTDTAPTTGGGLIMPLVVTGSVYISSSFKYTYDNLDRIATKKPNSSYTVTYNYLNIDTTKTTNLVSSINNNGNIYSYEYDDVGNITRVLKNSAEVNKYYYDSLNQLIKEDNQPLNKTYEYTYDNYGNILTKKEYQYKTTTLVSTKNYSYTNSNWKDQLTSFNGQSIAYDAIGNPLTYNGNTYTWINGRELQSITNGGNTYSYQYNASGIRTKKTINNVVTNYYLDGTDIIYEDRNGTILYYFYDESGVAGIEYQGNPYYYVKNLQGDIIEIISGTIVVASYKYDAWGNVTVTNNTTANLGDINPFRYRGYYYDSCSGLYYLNSRYYNPEWGRFINADGIGGANQDLLGYNLYAYTSNNPVVFSDYSGKGKIGAWFKKTFIDPVENAWNAINNYSAAKASQNATVAEKKNINKANMATKPSSQSALKIVDIIANSKFSYSFGINASRGSTYVDLTYGGQVAPNSGINKQYLTIEGGKTIGYGLPIYPHASCKLEVGKVDFFTPITYTSYSYTGPNAGMSFRTNGGMGAYFSSDGTQSFSPGIGVDAGSSYTWVWDKK